MPLHKRCVATSRFSWGSVDLFSEKKYAGIGEAISWGRQLDTHCRRINFTIVLDSSGEVRRYSVNAVEFFETTANQFDLQIVIS